MPLAAGADAVLHRVLNHRLEDKPGDQTVHQLAGQVHVHRQPLAVPLLDDVEVGVHIGHLLRQPHLGTALPVQGSVQHGGQGLNHLGCLHIPAHPGLPVDDLQGVVEEMGVDMGLEGFDLGVPPGQLLLVKAVELVAKLAGHLVEGVGEVLELPAPCPGSDLIAQLPLADLARPLHQRLNGLGDPPAEEPEGEQQKQQQGQPHGGQQPPVALRPGEQGGVVHRGRPPQDVIPVLDSVLQGTPPRLGRGAPL